MGCWSGDPTLPSPSSQSSPSAPQAPRHIRASSVQHWGSFFGGGGGNFDVVTKPTNVLLPGVVAQVASSNSTEYALLTNGKLYAWGLGSQGQRKHSSHEARQNPRNTVATTPRCSKQLANIAR